MNDLDIRSLMYAFKDELNLSMIEFEEYIHDNFGTIECNNAKKNYIYLTTNDYDIVQCVTDYIKYKIDNDENMSIDDSDELYDSIYEYIDIFIDIIEKDDDTYIIELVK